ncbi:hypothetical protein NM559_004078 [Vibrio alginolyticus]|nr:hypothetical protein [Vibrio alginolyticus]
MAILTTIAALSSIVPAIAKWIGGDKAEQAAEAIAEVAQKVTGVSDPARAAAQIHADPKAQKEFILAMESRRNDFDQMFLADKQNARKMQVEIVKSAKSKKAKEFIYNYAWFMSIASFLYFAAITFFPIPDGSQRYADTILGFLLGTVLGAIVAFFYGASKPVGDDE